MSRSRYPKLHDKLEQYRRDRSPVGGWVLRRFIASGGSGDVYLAEKGGREGAIKVYAPDSHEENLGAIDDRIEQQLRLRKPPFHSHIVKFLDGGCCKATDLHYVTTEYINRPTLTDLLKAGPVPAGRISCLVEQLADAARFLEEEKGLAHRDIKPSNILVDENYEALTLLDLGVVKRVEVISSDLTVGFFGTIRYAAPEVLTGDAPDTVEGLRAVSFYQVGAVIYEMLTGKLLHHRVDEVSKFKLVQAVREDDPDWPPTLLEDPGTQALAELGRACLAKDPAERLSTEGGWHSFSRDRMQLRPTIVLLYAGGTIGSEQKEGRSNQRGLRTLAKGEPGFGAAFVDRVEREYRQILDPVNEKRVEFAWESLPESAQILSENADFSTWNELGRAVRRVASKYSNEDTNPGGSEEPNGERPAGGAADVDKKASPGSCYLAGIIVLHGTDTLAYSAAALSFSLRHLGCPVVLTGSNRPPMEDEILERDLVAAQSDVWRNIVGSTNFILSFGHRLTEVVVFFDGRVHNGLNLRKVRIDDLSARQRSAESYVAEPFMFKNQGAGRDYMFREIDGLFCNNYYPVEAKLKFDTLISGEFRHARRNPLVDRPTLDFDEFRERVSYVKPHPCAVSGLPEGRCLVIDGYKSGTFPSGRSHPFSEVLSGILDKRIPAILVTDSGLIPTGQTYELSQEGDAQDLPIIRLFSVIPETAIPLLSLLVGGVDERVWNEATLARRVEIIKSQFANHMATHVNILTWALRDCLNEDAQRTRLKDFRAAEESEIARVVTRLKGPGFAEKPSDGLPIAGPDGLDSGQPRRIAIRWPVFLWEGYRLQSTFERSGCGPEFFQQMSDMGFEWASKKCSVEEVDSPNFGEGLYWSRGEDSRANQLANCESSVRRLVAGFERSGTADVAFDSFGLEEGPPPQLSLVVNCRKAISVVRTNELYGVESYAAQETELFQTLAEGRRVGEAVGRYKERLEVLWQSRFRGQLRARLSFVDWFVVGAMKAVMCWSLRYLNFDGWVGRCNSSEPAHVRALRRSVRVEVRRGGEDTLALHFTYLGRDQL